MERPGDDRRASPHGRATRRARQRQILDLIAGERIGSQHQLAERLAERGFEVTQATVSRDIAELGLVKAVVGDRHVYASPTDLAARPTDNAMLLRVLADVPVEIRRSGLILLLVSTPGTAQIIAEAIDHSTLNEPVGTLAGDNTVLVLFADEPALEGWRDRLTALQAEARAAVAAGDRG